jgi:hypothetical protein
VNRKKLARPSKTTPELRNAQFEAIAKLREDFAQRALPVISVDTKKKELVGLFKNPGVAWSSDEIRVNDHDFPSQAIGKAIPYGIYDVRANRGTMVIGTTHDTAQFAVDAIDHWWANEGRARYGSARELLILADGGGSNAATNRSWKRALDELARRHSLTVRVAHYPPGTSKWNPIEHRLFSEITKNWSGRPLDTYDTILHYIRSTNTATGLTVSAHFLDRPYAKGVKVSDSDLRSLGVRHDDARPRWNYVINPAALQPAIEPTACNPPRKRRPAVLPVSPAATATA